MRVLLSFVFVAFGGTAQAHSCIFPQIPLLPIDETPRTDAETLRATSKNYAELFQEREPTDILVFGQFKKTNPEPFLHEEHIEALRDRNIYEPNMPYRVEYTYLDAYEFSGHRLENGALVPFSVDGIDLKVSFVAEYDGLLDLLPGEATDLIGILRHLKWGARPNYEIETAACPTYHSIEPLVLEELLVCYREGACR